MIIKVDIDKINNEFESTKQMLNDQRFVSSLIKFNNIQSGELLLVLQYFFDIKNLNKVKKFLKEKMYS